MSSGPDFELEELRANMRAVLADIAAPEHVRKQIESEAPLNQALWDKTAELGWFGLIAPEEAGGLGLGYAAAALMYEEIGRRVAPLPALGVMLAIEALMEGGDAAQRAAWLPGLASGELPAAISAQGIALDWSQARLTRHADCVELDGYAAALLDGAAAKLLLIAAQEEGAARFVLVAPARDGVAVEQTALVDRTRHLGEVRFDRLRLPADRVLQGDAETIARALSTHAAIATACDSLGCADAIFEETLAYLKTREQFGKPIGSFQALKHRCADHKVALAAAFALRDEAVTRWARGEADAALYAALAKAQACDVAAAVATDAVQLHGGIGFTWEHDCHLYLKRAKLNQSLFGRAADHRDYAARLLMAA